jgi:hypothetical protein
MRKIYRHAYFIDAQTGTLAPRRRLDWPTATAYRLSCAACEEHSMTPSLEDKGVPIVGALLSAIDLDGDLVAA